MEIFTRVISSKDYTYYRVRGQRGGDTRAHTHTRVRAHTLPPAVLEDILAAINIIMCARTRQRG